MLITCRKFSKNSRFSERYKRCLIRRADEINNVVIKSGTRRRARWYVACDPNIVDESPSSQTDVAASLVRLISVV
jgi:hypothetical protein